MSHVQKANVDLTVLPVYKNYKICQFLPRGANCGQEYEDILCLGFRASYVNIYKENQLDAV